MDKRTYIQELAEYFADCRPETFTEETRHQARRCFLDYLGCAAFAGAHGCCRELVDLIGSLDGEQGKVMVWGEERTMSAPYAAFANAVRTAAIELDDCSGIGASVHPGVYVMSTVLALAQETETDEETCLKAVVFGYDICMRMGLLTTEQVRNLGLHGPGMMGGLAAAAAAGVMLGLNGKQLAQAISMTASLLPVCPFTSFMEGADAKDLYGGWGVYLGIFSAKAAARGMTGPKQVLAGEKSLSWLFAGDRGLDAGPGSHFYINDVSFKAFSACHSVHPAMSAVERLRERAVPDPAKIRHVTVSTYPYSYELNEGAREPFNASSARLSLSFTVAVALMEGELSPAAFLPDGLKDQRYLDLSRKISVEKNTSYGDGPFGIRGTKLRIEMEDGTVYEEEVTCAKWSEAPGDGELAGKFFGLTGDMLTSDEAERLRCLILEEKPFRFEPVREILTRRFCRNLLTGA